MEKKKFSLLSPSRKSEKCNAAWEYLNGISGEDIVNCLTFMFIHTNKGKKLFSELQNIFNEKDKYVIMRLASAYNTEDNAHTKVTILKTVCHEYSFHQLLDFGFHCTQGNYNYSKQSSSSSSLEISRAQKPKMPPSKRKLSNDEEKRFSEFISANSTESSEGSRRIISSKNKENFANVNDFAILNGEDNMEIDIDPLGDYFLENSDFEENNIISGTYIETQPMDNNSLSDMHDITRTQTNLLGEYYHVSQSHCQSSPIENYYENEEYQEITEYLDPSISMDVEEDIINNCSSDIMIDVLDKHSDQNMIIDQELVAHDNQNEDEGAIFFSLTNLGNSCYLASQIQIFRSIIVQCPDLQIRNGTFTSYFSNLLHLVSEEIIVKTKNSQLKQRWSPFFLRQFEKRHKLRQGLQQEFYETFLDLFNDLSIIIPNFAYHVNTSLSFPRHCSKCHCSVNGPFESTPIIRLVGSSCTEAFNTSFKMETSNKNNRYAFCEHCQSETFQLSHLKMEQFPQILSVSLEPAGKKRDINFQINETLSFKKDSYSIYVDRDLKRGSINYTLIGLLFYQGDNQHGHFYSIVQSKKCSNFPKLNLSGWCMCNDDEISPIRDSITTVIETHINKGSHPILSVYKKIDSNVDEIVTDILSPNLLDYHISNDYYQSISCHNSLSFHDDVSYQVSNEEERQNRVQLLHPHHSISKNFTSSTNASLDKSPLTTQPFHHFHVSPESSYSSTQSKSNNVSDKRNDNSAVISFHKKHVHHSPTNRKDTNAPKNASSNNFETIHSNNHSPNNISKHVPNESIDSSKLSFSTRNLVNSTDVREIGKTLIPSHEQESLQCSKQPIRIINTTKSELYEKFVKETKIKMSKSQFYKRTRRIKRATRRTDVCDLCEVYSSLKNKEKLLFQRSEQLNNEEKATIRLVEKHRILANNQQQYFRHLKNNLKSDEALLLFDYKENWSLPMRRNQTSRDFYNKVEVSHFCVIVYIADNNKSKEKHIFNFFSNTLSHDYKFTIECLQQVLSNPIFEKRKVFRFMCDTGSHFRNSQLMHFLLSNNSSFAKDKTISLSFFCEKHGKCECDGEFGHLSQCINNKLDNNTVISNIDELIKFFEIYSCHTGSFDDNNISNCAKTHRHFLKHSPSNKILWKKMVVSSLKTYLFYEKRGNKVFRSVSSPFNSKGTFATAFREKRERDERPKKTSKEYYHKSPTLSPGINTKRMYKEREKLDKLLFFNPTNDI